MKEFLIKENGEYTICLICESTNMISIKVDRINAALESVERRVEKLEGVSSQDTSVPSAMSVGKEADVSCRVGQLEERITGVEERITGVEHKVESSDGFQRVRRGARVVAGVSYSGVVTRNRYHVLEDEVRDEPEPSLMLVGDSLVRHQDEEFCRKGPRRKHLCYPGRKIEDITEKIDDLVVNSSEETVFVYLVGTNNVVSGRSEEIMKKYSALVSKLRDSRRRSVVCGLIPRYDVNSLMLSRMLGINARVEDLCKREGVMFVDVWDHFSKDRSLYGKDGLHLSSVGKARLGRVLDEGIRKELEKKRTIMQDGEAPPGQAGSGQSQEATVDRSSQVRIVRTSQTRSAGVQVGEGEQGIRNVCGVRNMGEESGDSVDQRCVATSTDDLNG